VRTISAALDKILLLSHRSTHVKVEIERTAGVGDFVDLTDLEGYNWILSVEYGESIDQPQATARVQLNSRIFNLSLAPLITLSKLSTPTPIVDIGRDIRISTATLPIDILPSSSDFTIVFEGNIDDVSMTEQGHTIDLSCRDRGGALMDLFIERERKFGADIGRDIELVIQDILDAFGGGVVLFSENGTGGTPFLPGDSPGWAISTFTQTMEAIRTLASQVGFDIRYQFHPNTNDFQLVLFEPDRIFGPLIDRTFEPSQYFTVGGFSISRRDVRNVIRVTFRDQENRQQSTEVSDAASITKYGRRFMQIAEEETLQLDTFTEANRMRDAALFDLNEPEFVQSVTMPYFFPAELNDIYKFPSNGVHYDTDQVSAVFSFSHRLTRDDVTTTIGTSGLRKTRVKGALVREQVVPRKLIGPDNVSFLTPPLSILANGTFSDWTRK